MKKQFKVYQAHPNYIAIDYIEDGEITGGYLIPSHDRETVESMTEYMKKEGYVEYGSK